LEWSDIIPAVMRAVVGALIGAGGTWWVSVRLDRQRASRELVSTLGILSAELEDNRRRIADEDNPMPLKERLTIGDWDAMKGSFAGLAVRDERLWEATVTAYGLIHEYRSAWRDRPPSSDELGDLVIRLRVKQRLLAREIGTFSRMLGGVPEGGAS
jgi:hypothetical protein